MQKQRRELGGLAFGVALSVFAAGALIFSAPLNAAEECNNKKCEMVVHEGSASPPTGRKIRCPRCPATLIGVPLYSRCIYEVSPKSAVGFRLVPAKDMGASLDGGGVTVTLTCWKYSCASCTQVGDSRSVTVKKNCQDAAWVEWEEELAPPGEEEEEEEGQ